jgi:histone H2B
MPEAPPPEEMEEEEEAMAVLPPQMEQQAPAPSQVAFKTPARKAPAKTALRETRMATGRRSSGRGRRRRVETWKRYVHRVLKQIHPELGISSKAMEVSASTTAALPCPVSNKGLLAELASCLSAPRAPQVMNSFMGDLYERIVAEAARLTRLAKRATLSAREVQTAVRLLLQGELGRHAAAEGHKAVTRAAGA